MPEILERRPDAMNGAWLHAKRGSTYDVITGGRYDGSRPGADDDKVIVVWHGDRETVTVIAHHDPVPAGAVAEGATLQTASPIGKGDMLLAYRAQSDGVLWARPYAEFVDGRFLPTS